MLGLLSAVRGNRRGIEFWGGYGEPPEGEGKLCRRGGGNWAGDFARIGFHDFVEEGDSADRVTALAW